MTYRAGQKLLLQKEYMERQERQERERQEHLQRQMQQRGDQLSVPLAVHQQQRMGGGAMDIGEVPTIQVCVVGGASGGEFRVASLSVLGYDSYVTV